VRGHDRAVLIRSVVWLALLHASIPVALLVHGEPRFFALWAGLHGFYYFGMAVVLHRYLSHRSFAVSRPVQVALMLWACTCGQRSPLWWAATHRRHHRNCDSETDPHSPVNGRGRLAGLARAHVGWLFERQSYPLHWDAVRDFTRYPEMVALNNYYFAVTLVPIGIAWAGMGGGGAVWAVVAMCTSFHCTALVNSIDHVFGAKPFEADGTRDCNARNCVWSFPLQPGENWHNNHHVAPSAASVQFRWWQLDPPYYVIRALELLGLARDVRRADPRRLAEREADRRRAIAAEQEA
jgi:stearoyl-CoA desaturase (delta-9 desaturase)